MNPEHYFNLCVALSLSVLTICAKNLFDWAQLGTLTQVTTCDSCNILHWLLNFFLFVEFQEHSSSGNMF